MDVRLTATLGDTGLYRWVAGFALKYWPTGVIALLAMVVDACCATGFAKTIQPMIDDAFAIAPKVSAQYIAFCVLSILAVRSLAGYVADVGMSRLGRMTVRDVRVALFDAYLDRTEEVDSRDPVGDRVSRAGYTVEQVAFSVTEAIKVAVLDGLTAIFGIGFMLYTNVVFAMVTLALIPILGGVILVSGKFTRRGSAEVQSVLGELDSSVLESSIGARDICVYLAKADLRERFIGISNRLSDLGIKLSRTASGASALVQLVGGVALAIVILLASGRDIPVEERISAGEFFAIVTAMGIVVPSLRRLANVHSGIQKGLAAAAELRVIIDFSPPRHGDVRLEVGAHDVQLKRVCFAYPDGEVVLRNLDLVFRKGEVTALVGASGSGKSTILALVAGFRQPTSGDVFIAGRPMSAYRTESLMESISWVGQGGALFTGTIRENVALGSLRASSDEDILNALGEAHALDFVSSLPAGLNTLLGPEGIDLSAGQKQRILVARAILRRGDLVLLDEVTSSLDPESERLVADGLQRLMRGRTCIVIAHRLKTIRHADRIVVLNDGMIVEDGTHADLVTREGAYSRLFRESSSLA
ncbi:ATP-binding cassette domain-containing protein [Luteibacter aegosomatis]|uniref:ABC transporter ATP-binding protein n=1 Tax=Luteibacter aegosomatis TaxID=2911537 RepID=UPI001FF7AD5B|nr:ATP-binding cassette domain-containing protein [Luteibacter aegosomatis]UPG87204.1 ATP-binding cassette domain-containing protein [Luteibacter aegosomatis]